MTTHTPTVKTSTTKICANTRCGEEFSLAEIRRRRKSHVGPADWDRIKYCSTTCANASKHASREARRSTPKPQSQVETIKRLLNRDTLTGTPVYRVPAGTSGKPY